MYYICGDNGGNNMISIKFLFHTHKNKADEQQLLVRVSMGRTNRVSIPTGVKIKKKHWDLKTELVKSVNPNSKILNTKVVELKQKRDEAIAKYQASTDNKPFGFLSVCNYMQGKQDVTS